LFEQAREIVLQFLQLHSDKYAVIFCTPRRAEMLQAAIAPAAVRCVSSQEIGLPLGVRALAVERRALPKGAPLQPGGGTARLVAPGWVVWAAAPDRFEAGTPAIVNVIAFARALQLVGRDGPDAFRRTDSPAQAVADILHADEWDQGSGRALLDKLRKSRIGAGVLAPTAQGAQPYINLDNGASTPTFAPIWAAAWQAWRQGAGQPGQQGALIGEVKAVCAGVLGAPPAAYDVVFTSNTTEAINLVAESLHNEQAPGEQWVVLNTLLEHNSNELPWRTTPGLSLLRLTVDAEGFVNPQELEELLRAYNEAGQHGPQRIKLVAVSGASNVLGVFNDLAEISRIAHQYGARLLVDAAQLVAHRSVDVEACGIDYLAFSAHKAYAPFGAGVLLAKRELLHFSAAEWASIRASGEENVGGVAALGMALRLLQRIGFDLIQAEEEALTAQALAGLAQSPRVNVYGIKDPDSPHFASKGGVIIFDVKGMQPSRVAQELAERGGIGVRSGCHCAHLLVKHLLHIPPLLEQFQGAILNVFPKLALPGVVRISLGIENSAEDVAAFLDTLGQIAEQPKGATSVKPQIEAFAQAAAQRVYA
jgi:selenocysteine lyase/cysteine desulfurase